ncbi:MAG: GlcG/HbpS family heme-binding protein [Pseudomonadales bacterium]
MLTIKRLSHSDALLLIEGARNKALEIGVPMCIAVTDESGVLIAFERMDGGKTTSVVIAQDKAFTAAAARKATHDYNSVNTPGSLAFGIHTEHGGRISSVGGGLPVFCGDDVVGGIGISSGTPQQDLECAQAGVDHFNARA